jgi:hypothetical protein
MSEDARRFAKKEPNPETKKFLGHIANWVEVCEDTIFQQKNMIRELTDKVAQLQGDAAFKMRFKGGRSSTTIPKKETEDAV